MYKIPPDFASLRGFFFLRAYARSGSECCQYRRCYRCDELNNELNGFLLTHNINVSLGFAAWLRQECLMFNVKGGAFAPTLWSSRLPFRRFRLSCLRRYRRLRCFRLRNYHPGSDCRYRPDSDYHSGCRSQDPPRYHRQSRLRASPPCHHGRSR